MLYLHGGHLPASGVQEDAHHDAHGCIKASPCIFLARLPIWGNFCTIAFMSNRQKNLLTALFVVIIVGVVSVYIFNDLRKPIIDPAQSIDKKIETKPLSLGDETSGQSIRGNVGEGYKITILPNEDPKIPSPKPKIPDLSLSVTNYSHLDEAAFRAVSQNMAEVAQGLKKDPNNELGWLNLGVYRKMLGDYQEAANIINYVAIVWPDDYAPYNNLADLYQFYSKNYPLAEKNWLKVIELRPNYLQAYENLYNLYKDPNYKEKEAKALPVLLQGLGANPKSIELMLGIARHYRLVGDTDKSAVYYTKGIDEAKLEKNEQLEASLRSELAEISQ